MPKQTFEDGKLSIREDAYNPQDKLKVLQKEYKNKDLKSIADAKKVLLFDAYVDADIIKL